MQILRERGNVRTQADGNHYQVVVNEEIAFDERGPWAAKEASEIFDKYASRKSTEQVLSEVVTWDINKPVGEWSDKEISDYARTMTDAVNPSQNIETYRTLIKKQTGATNPLFRIGDER